MRVVAYDISSDKQRQKAAEALLMVIPRVQESVFEGDVPEGVLAHLANPRPFR
jgi:CRISPR-associated endonuclease Cas2